MAQFYACQRAVTDVSPYPPIVDLPRDVGIAGVPVILVGRIVNSQPIRKDIHSPWSSDRRYNYDLHRARIDVETVLAGTVASKTLDVFFFRSINPVGLKLLGTVEDGGSWRVGQREMLFLQVNNGCLRTVCDTYAHCAIQVLSGSHKNALGADTWIGQKIVDVLLTRGDGVSDEAFAQAIARSSGEAYDFDRTHTFEVLQRIAELGNPALRSAASTALHDLQ